MGTPTRRELLAELRQAIDTQDAQWEMDVREALDAQRYVDPPPEGNDARQWDAWRNRQGYSGCHH